MKEWRAVSVARSGEALSIPIWSGRWNDTAIAEIEMLSTGVTSVRLMSTRAGVDTIEGA